MPERGDLDFAQSFEAGFDALQVVIEEACAAPKEWPHRVALAIHRSLVLAVEDPVAAELLVNESLARGRDGLQRYERLMAFLASRLTPGRLECPRARDLPDTLERALAGGVVFLVSRRLEQGRVADLPAAIPDAIEFVLTPYVGAAEAEWIARSA